MNKRINDKKEGLWKYYYDNGDLRYVRNYKDGKAEGLWEYYVSGGRLWFRSNYKNDKADGLREEYYKNGNIKEQSFLKEGNCLETIIFGNTGILNRNK
jgi:antitoxin component YwqK of YwqJK toxin-antitoxin module